MATIKSVSTLLVDGDWIESKDQSLEGIRLIQTGNIGIGEYLDKTNRAKYISEETLERLNCTELMSGDILISRLPDPIGRACRVPNNIGRAITAVDCTIIRLNPDKCDAEYFVQYTQSKMYQNRLSQFFAGSTRTRISRKNLEQVEIPLPSIAEQRHIALTLGKVDNLIALRKEQLAKLDELVKARFVEIFGDPISNPMGWECKRFDSLCENLDYRRKPITASERESGIYPYYGASGIVDYVAGYLFDEDILLISEDGANLLMRSTPIAFSVSGKVWVNNHAHVLRFEKMCMQKYVEMYFSMINISEFITGSAQPKLNQAKLNSMMIPVPDDDGMNSYLQFIQQTNKTKLTIQSSLDKLEVMKKALMQEYFG